MTVALRKAQTLIFNRLAPDLFWQVISRKLARRGIRGVYVILSFDCDTDEDANAALILHRWLTERDISAAYAVPGAQLERGAAIYRQIAEAGGTFLNHGALPHTLQQGDSYISSTFYNKMSLDEVRADVQHGHEIVTRVIGKAPTGFRTPHFGYFQSPEQLRFLHDLLKSMGYRFSTSTMPRTALNHHPVWQIGAFTEVPLSGWYQQPLNLLDSFTLIESPTRRIVTDSYAQRLIDTVTTLRRKKLNAILNYYVDPAHVYKTDTFTRAIDAIRQHVTLWSYDDVVART